MHAGEPLWFFLICNEEMPEVFQLSAETVFTFSWSLKHRWCLYLMLPNGNCTRLDAGKHECLCNQMLTALFVLLCFILFALMSLAWWEGDEEKKTLKNVFAIIRIFSPHACICLAFLSVACIRCLRLVTQSAYHDTCYMQLLNKCNQWLFMLLVQEL